MKTMLACAAFLAALHGGALAGELYDRKLEAAMKAKVASSIGDTRGGFGYGQQVQFIRIADSDGDRAAIMPASDGHAEPVLFEIRGSVMNWMSPRKVRVVF